ncbi:MAG: tRNA pseudouridine(55) synthase TruB [Actinomycetota bacterium]|nr:tRNA pseudouridine(55) synthase TruB [Actinomycetota bacterium]
MTADGLLVVDKPAGWTSHDVVAKARWLCGTRKVGHAGTLDPMATGVLVLGIGRATKLLTYLVGCDKAYTATVRLGQATLTDDAEGEVTATQSTAGVTEAAVHEQVQALTGAIAQVPSSVSAIKVDGKRSYARVRGGEEVSLPSRPVTVSRFEVLSIRRVSDVLDVDVEVEVSSGTYVRALARDLGASLGVGGHLTALRRTRVGRFGLDVAHPLDQLVGLAEQAQTVGEPRGSGIPVVPMGEAARAQFAVHEVSTDEVRTIGFGQRVASVLVGEPVVAAIGPDGELVAMLDETREQARSLVVFPTATS